MTTDKKISGILVTMVAPFENHIANGGDKLFGNANSIKRRPDGRVYVSGQMQRHVLFTAIDRLNTLDPNKGETFVSNGDGITNQIEKDIRADLGGFMHTSKKNYSDRRMAPLSVTPALALEPGAIGRDLLVCFHDKNNKDGNVKNQVLATKEFSERDMMQMNFFLDVTSVGVSKGAKYEKGFNIDVEYFKHISDEERKRRVRLFLEATKEMNDYANQARNAVCGEPEKVLIVFDDRLSRKASRYFSAGEIERKNIMHELDDRKVTYFLGDDKTEKSVYQAYQEALSYLATVEFVDFAEGQPIVTFAEAFGVESDNTEKKKNTKNISEEE